MFIHICYPGLPNVRCQTQHAIIWSGGYNVSFPPFSDVSNMNEGNSAGGGHEGLSPAPPAVSDRVTLQSTEKSVTTPKSTATAHNNNKSSSATSTVATTQQKPSKQQQQQQQLLSAQLPVPLSNLSTEATAAATPAAASTYSSNSAKADTSVSESIAPPQAKRQRLEDTEVGGEVASDNSNSNIVGAVCSNIVGSLLPASVVASSEVGGAISTALQDLNALKKRILQQKYQILRNLKER